MTQSHMVHQVLQHFGFHYSSPQSTPLPTGHSLSAPPSDESVEPSGPYPELVGCLMYLMTCTRPDLAYPLSLLAGYVALGRHRKAMLAMLALCHKQRLEHRRKHIALRYFHARELQQRGQLRLSYVASRANTADVFIKALESGRYRRVRLLGKGSQATVWECKDLHNPSGPHVACKSFSRLKSSANRAIINEVLALKKLRGHSNIVEFIDLIVEADECHAIVELAPEGDLVLEIMERGPMVDEAQAVNLARQLASAVAFCHASGIVHRDIKPDNVLVVMRPVDHHHHHHLPSSPSADDSDLLAVDFPSSPKSTLKDAGPLSSSSFSPSASSSSSSSTFSPSTPCSSSPSSPTITTSGSRRGASRSPCSLASFCLLDWLSTPHASPTADNSESPSTSHHTDDQSGIVNRGATAAHKTPGNENAGGSADLEVESPPAAPMTSAQRRELVVGVKLTDFGGSAVLKGGLSGVVKGRGAGTRGYMAPEVITGQAYGYKADVYSLGITLSTMLTGHIPATPVDFSKPIWENVPEGAKDLIRQMLYMDPNQRLSSFQVMEHPWLNQPEARRADVTTRNPSLLQPSAMVTTEMAYCQGSTSKGGSCRLLSPCTGRATEHNTNSFIFSATELNAGIESQQ
ncbi:unnamed protein product [Closterium sp. NIES-54]